MTTDIRSLALQLRAWSEPIASGYEVPAAARTLHAAADALEAMAGEVATLRERTAISLGVGDGNGSLFVYGDHESIKAAQGFIIRENELLAERDRLKAALEKIELLEQDHWSDDAASICRKALGGDAS